MDLEFIAQFGGASVLTAALVEAIKRILALSESTQDRVGPLLALVVGVAVVLFAQFGLDLWAKADIVAGVFTGIFAGLSAIGLYKTVQSPTR